MPGAMVVYYGPVLNESVRSANFGISWDSPGLKVKCYLESSGWKVIMQVAHDSTTSSYYIDQAMIMTGWGGSEFGNLL